MGQQSIKRTESEKGIGTAGGQVWDTWWRGRKEWGRVAVAGKGCQQGNPLQDPAPHIALMTAAYAGVLQAGSKMEDFELAFALAMSLPASFEQIKQNLSRGIKACKYIRHQGQFRREGCICHSLA